MSRPSRNGFSQLSSSYSRRLCVESLEDRRMLATLTVNSALDNVTPSDNLVTLREAIQAANTDGMTDLGQMGSGADTIVFDATVFGTPKTIALSLGDLEITEDLTIIGPGQTLLTIDAQQLSRVLNISVNSGDYEFSGMTLTGGRASGYYRGGAVRSYTQGSLAFDDVTITNSITTGLPASGHGIGGGMFVHQGGVTLTRSTVSDNAALGQFSSGGGIFSFGPVTLIDTVVRGNSTADGPGGGISTNSTVSLTRSAVADNTAMGESGIGGGIRGGIVTLVDSTVSGNRTTGDNARGGGIRSSAVSLINSTVSGNSTAGANSDGGGVSASGNITISRSTITDNHANHLTSTGGGIWNLNAPIVIDNSILAGNTAGGGNLDLNPGSGTLEVDYSLIGNTTGSGITAGTGVGNLLDQDAELAPLGNYGGPTRTHALLATSLAIDGGDPSPASPPANDQRGLHFARIAGLAPDMGAYEVQSIALVVDTLDDESDYDFTATNLSLREALEQTNANPGADSVSVLQSLSGGTVFLDDGQLSITDDLTLIGLPDAQFTVSAQNASRVLLVDNLATVEISGLTLANGNSDLGGGLRLNSGTTAVVYDVVIENNTTTGSGAGLWNDGELTLSDSSVRNNMATAANAQGGGIYNSGTADVVRSTISGNTITNSIGGGLINRYGTMTVTESTIADNDGSHGGGAATFGGMLSISGTTLSGNSAFYGGGAFNRYGIATISGSTITGNTASYGGGFFTDGYSTSSIRHSTITDNSGSFDGGGITVRSGYLTLGHSIVSGNTSPFGSEVRNGYATLYLDDFNLFGSSSQSTASALHSVSPGASDITATSDGTDPHPLAGIMQTTLTNNGGPTLTHGLAAGSPALDAGDSGFSGPPNYDQRGFAFDRVIGSRVDIGAFESGATSADFDTDGDVDGFDFLAWQRGFGGSPVVHSDGDANVNGAVDAVDLSIWETTFGLVEPPSLAAASARATELAVQPSTVTEQAPLIAPSTKIVQFTPPPSAAELVDAALAWDSVSQSNNEEPQPLERPGTHAEVFIDIAFATGNVVPAESTLDDADTLAESSAEAEHAEDQSLEAELLEQVFG